MHNNLKINKYILSNHRPRKNCKSFGKQYFTESTKIYSYNMAKVKFQYYFPACGMHS